MEEPAQDINDRLARLERENRQLRAKLEASAGFQPRSPIDPRPMIDPRPPVGCWSMLAAALILVPTILFPPWMEVRTQRSGGLFFSEHVKDIYSSFAGFDFLLSKTLWKDGPSREPSFGEHFEVTVYRIIWPMYFVMLFGESLFLWAGAVGIDFALGRRRWRIREATKPKGLCDSMDVGKEKSPHRGRE